MCEKEQYELLTVANDDELVVMHLCFYRHTVDPCLHA